MNCTLYCIVMYCTVMYCTLYRTVMYTELHTVLYFNVLYIVPYCNVHCTVHCSQSVLQSSHPSPTLHAIVEHLWLICCPYREQYGSIMLHHCTQITPIRCLLWVVWTVVCGQHSEYLMKHYSVLSEELGTSISKTYHLSLSSWRYGDSLRIGGW